MGGYLRSYLGAQRPVGRPAPGGGPFEGPSGPAQGGPCDVVSPADSGGGARLSLEKAGGKNTREEEVLPPWTYLFWLGGPCGGPPSFLPGLRPIIQRP